MPPVRHLFVSMSYLQTGIMAAMDLNTTPTCYLTYLGGILERPTLGRTFSKRNATSLVSSVYLIPWTTVGLAWSVQLTPMPCFWAYEASWSVTSAMLCSNMKVTRYVVSHVFCLF